MLARARRGLPIPGGASIRRANMFLSALLVVVVAGFIAYYVLDQRGRAGATGQTILTQQIRQAEEAVRKNPNDVRLRLAVANLYSQAGDYRAAIAQYEQSIKLQDPNLPAAYGMAHAYMQLGEGPKALPGLLRNIEEGSQVKALARSETMAGAHLYAGKIYMDSGDGDKAAEHLGQSLAIEPADADASFLLGEVQRRKGELDKAMDLYRRSLELVPNFAEAYRSMGEVHRAKGDMARASYTSAMVRYSRGDYPGAAAELESLLRTSPNLWEAHLGLGMAYERQRKADRAIPEYRKALEINPKAGYAAGRLAALGETPPTAK